MEHQADRGAARRALPPTVLFALAGLVAVPVAGEEEIWRTIFRGATEVNVVNVDVVVTDARGRPVTGLAREDFELLDGGRRVEISNFFAVEDGRAVPLLSAGGTGAPEAAAEADAGAGAAATAGGDEPPAAAPPHLIVFVDNVNLAEIHRARVFGRLRDFLLAQRQFGARVMLMSNDRGLRVRQGFTSVPHEVFVALAELEKTAAPSPRFHTDRRNLLRAIERVNVEEGSGLFDTKGHAGQLLQATSESNTDQQQLRRRTVAEAEALVPEIEAYSQLRLQHTLDSLGVLHQLVDAAAGLPGRKSVLYVSDGLVLKPGEAIWEAYSRRFTALADVGARIHVESRAARDDATPRLEALLELANAGNVTFYTLDASPAEKLAYGAAESDHGSGGNFASWNDGMASIDEHGSQHGLRMMAQATGGRFAPVHTAWGAVLDGIVTDFDNYYSLGFAAERDPEREQRSIEVKVRREGLTVRHRSSFRDQAATARTAGRARAALLIDGAPNPLGIALEAGAPEPQEDGTWVVPLRVALPLDKLVLLPGESEHQGRVSMFVAVRDEKGRTSDVLRHLCPIRIPNAEVLTALGQRASCGVRLRMRRGPQRIAVSVLDELTAVDSTAHLAIDVGGDVAQASLDAAR